MAAPFRRLIEIGIEPTDDPDVRLRKFLLVAAVLTLVPLTVLWGSIYWLAGAPQAAAIPWLYAVLSVVSLVVFAMRHRYVWLAASQFALFSIFPFWLMWVLVPAPSGPGLPSGLRDLLFTLNLTFVPLVTWLLVRLFASGREGSLAAVRGIVRRYFSPELASVLEAEPERAELGGSMAQVTVMFADLGSYSTYAETRSPDDVVRMLNRYFAIVLPTILHEGGTPTQLPGDAVMAVFGAPHPQADHAARACRAAWAILERTEPLATGPTPGPRFHIGVHSGPALVGNIGSEEYRNFTAIGDTTNVAARLLGVADPGQIVVGPVTAATLDGSFELTALGPVHVKGRVEPLEIFSLRASRHA